MPTGGVKPRAVWWYIRCQGPLLALVWTILLLIFEFLHVFSNIWLAMWTGDERLKSSPNNSGATFWRNLSSGAIGLGSTPLPSSVPITTEQSPPLSSGGSPSAPTTNLVALQFYYIAGYGFFTIARVVFNVTHIIGFVYANLRASRIMHHKLLSMQMSFKLYRLPKPAYFKTVKLFLDCVVRAPMSFFDTTPSGRVINRMSKDIDMIDNVIPMSLRSFLTTFFNIFQVLAVIVLATPFFLFVIIPLGIVYWLIQRFYIPTSRQLKRLESTSRSPVFNHFSESLQGIFDF